VAADPAELAALFEGAPSFVARLQAVAADGSLAELLERAEAIALAMPENEQIELLNAHPRIGAAPGSVSAHSYREQGYDHDPGTAELQARLDALNEAYERRFGFRFVVFVAGRSRAEIAQLMERHLAAEREAEKEHGLRDVVAIARDRAARFSTEVPRR
jgi:2-oxo-4-hydroxy-4-carboxy--5-ureidoimidazoline (OHCU) decarboxylase